MTERLKIGCEIQNVFSGRPTRRLTTLVKIDLAEELKVLITTGCHREHAPEVF